MAEDMAVRAGASPGLSAPTDGVAPAEPHPTTDKVLRRRHRAWVTALLIRLPGVLVVVVPLTLTGVVGASGESVQDSGWPLTPRPSVVRGFDPPDRPWGAGHRGVDLAGSAGQVVHSPVAGRVRFAGAVAGKPLVVVDLGATRTTLEPVLPTVRVGEAVRAGQAVGTLSSLFSHCAPAACLHWGLIRNSDGVYLDPLSLIGEVRVRLLPLWREFPVERSGWG